MRSLAARGFSFSKLRRLSTTHVDAKISAKRVANQESSESRTLNTLQSVHMDPAEGGRGILALPEEEEVEASQVAPDIIDSHFDTDYLQQRQSLLAYGKQMKRSDDGTKLKGALGLASQGPQLEPQTDARLSKSLPKSTTKPPRPQSSWVAKVMRDSGSRREREHGAISQRLHHNSSRREREQSGSKSQRLLHSASS